MEGIFSEFENENGLRRYPFAAGCVPPEGASGIPEGLFVDASFYPVNPNGMLYLSGVSEDGTFTVSDDAGPVMSGVPSGDMVEFYDMSGLDRHVGTLMASSDEALSEFAFRGSERGFSASETAFASSCVFPVAVDGVTTLSVGDAGRASRIAGFANESTDTVRVSGGKRRGNDTLRFDVLPRPGSETLDSIRRVICVVDGQTPFRIAKLGEYNTVFVYLHGIDKEAVCAAAHRENAYEMADTCDCERPAQEKTVLPHTKQRQEVYIPDKRSKNAFYLSVQNITGYDNPLSLTMEDGMTAPDTDGLESVEKDGLPEIAEDEFVDEVTSKGVTLQVPGLSGGLI